MGEAALRALKHAVVVGDFNVNGGLALDPLGATVVARAGTVWAIPFTGPTWRHHPASQTQANFQTATGVCPAIGG